MPKKRDPTLMESLQRQDLKETQLKAAASKNLSPATGLKKGLRITQPDVSGRRGLPK